MPGKTHTVTFEATGHSGPIVVAVERGTTLKAAASVAGVHLDAPCGGAGTCGRCRVVAHGGVDVPTAEEIALAGANAIASGVRLACHARVVGDVRVMLDSGGLDTLRIVEAARAGDLVVEPPAARGILGEGPLLGLVVDIGTTTLVVALVDLESGEQLGSASALNPQHGYGHDVMSRITYAAAHGTERLQRPVLGAIDSLGSRVLAEQGFSAGDVREIAIAGNTTMIHLLLGVDTTPLGSSPYEPAFCEAVDKPASEVGLGAFPSARVYVMPGISAFVGGDITAGLLAAELTEPGRTTVLIDLGTNGEIVLRTPDGLVACSTAAGPALEGASIAHGMRAEAGAIERVALAADGELLAETIGGGEAKGLCGSGLLDLVAVLLDSGVLDFRGRLQDSADHPLAAHVSEREGTRSFEVAPGVYLTQKDVRQVQLANAAISSGIEMLLDHAGVPIGDVDEFVIAGGFGYHVKADALVRMGMIPAAWRDRVTFAGNTAKAGTLRALLDSASRRRAESVSLRVAPVDLASHPEFQTRFVRAMHFPAKQPKEENTECASPS